MFKTSNLKRVLGTFAFAMIFVLTALTVSGVFALEENAKWPIKTEVVSTESGTRITVDGEVIIPFWSYGNAGPIDSWRYFNSMKYSEPSQRCVYMLSTGFDFSSEATRESLRETMNTLLEIDPDAFVVWRGSAFAAGEWGSHSTAVPYVDGYDYALRWDGTAEGKPIGLGWLSMCSDRWKENIRDNYTRGIEWMATEAFASHVIGFQPGSGTYFEWVFVTNDDGANPGDYSGASKDKFKEWLREKYGTEEALRKAWKNNTVTFETAEIPNPTERRASDDGRFLTYEGGSGNVIDYNRFYNESYATAMEFIGKVIKEASGDSLLACYLYGYYYSYIRYPQPVQTGAYGLTRLLESEYIDVLSSTNIYEARALGDVDINTSVVDSYLLNNKVYVSEDDTRTYLSDPSYGYEEGGETYRASDYIKTIGVLRRNFAYFAVRDAGAYWMDMHAQGWYADADLWEDLAELRRIWAVMNYQSADKGFRPEVAYIVDDESLYYEDADNHGITVTNYTQTYALARVGFSYGTYLKCDLGKLPDSVKLVILTGVYFTDAEARQAIENLKSEGRVIVFTRAPGYINENGANVANISAMTGMTIAKLDKCIGQTTITNTMSNITSGAVNAKFGISWEFSPMFYVADSKATRLGVYTNTDYTSLAVKDMGDWTSVFSGSVEIPAVVLRNIAKLAGVHCYTPDYNNDSIETDMNFLSYLPTSVGTKTIVLPKPSHVVDMLTGETIGNGITTFNFTAEYEGDIQFYSITAGEATSISVKDNAIAKTFLWDDKGAGINTLKPGEQIGFTFTGTFVSINAPKGPGNGSLKVTIDGMEYPIVNLNTRDTETNPNAEIVLAHGLKNTTHTVILEVDDPIDYSAGGAGYDTSTPERNTTHGDEVPEGWTNASGGDRSQYNMGIKFAVKTPGKITHARLLANVKACGLHEVTLWRAADQAILAGPFQWDLQTTEPAWCEFEFPEPIKIEAGVDYTLTIAYLAGPTNYYWGQGQFFPVKDTNSVFITYSDSGLFKGGTSGYPTLTFNATSYGRDVVFSFADSDVDTSGSNPAGSSITDKAATKFVGPTASSDEDLNMGVKFQVKVNGAITKAKLVADKVSNGLHKVTLYDYDTRKPVAGPYDWNVNVSSKCWAEYTFAEPIVIDANRWYVLTITDVSGKNHYGFIGEFFYDNQPENSVFVTDKNSGVFGVGTDAFPTQTYNGRNYGRDLVFVYDDTGSGIYDKDKIQKSVTINSVNVVGAFGEPPVLTNAVDWNRGDINFDESVDVLDVILLKKYLAGGTVFSEEQLVMADTDRSGAVNELDYANLFRFIFK